MIEQRVIIDSSLGNITIRRGRTKSALRATFKTDGTISVSTPSTISWKEIENWIEENRDAFIAKKIQATKDNNVALPTILSINNCCYCVKYEKILKAKVEHTTCGANLILPQGGDTERNRQIHEIFLNNTLKLEAQKSIPKRLNFWSTKLNLPFNSCSIKNNKTNWGSCSYLGNINLNMHLIRLPEHLMDMVIIHELAHTIIPNHGKEFKAFMKKIIPRVKEMEQELKTYHPHQWS
ncbi:M48 family metallopeptidase [Halosquirtibacter laminarini]|uniref:M48 family metallopeptidase n=1 Tax=Halosquirtibacter laminarini TaxID=3374600 RepID=A0AC61NCS3_9BACT|nr:M48 family metallopeptidase [Prolixibacteraceae bacterium]